MIYNKRDADLIISVISKKTGVKLICEGEVWQHDIEKKTISYPKDSVIDDETLACLIHEASHIRFTKIDSSYFDDVKEIAKKHNKDYKQVINIYSICEDLRIEQRISDIYLGARKILVAGSNQTHDKVLISYNKHKREKNYDALGKLLAQRASNFCYLFFIGEYISEFKTELYTNYCTDDTVDTYYKLQSKASIVKSLYSFSDMVRYVNENLMDDYLKLCDRVEEEEDQEKEEGEGASGGSGEGESDGVGMSADLVDASKDLKDRKDDDDTSEESSKEFMEGRVGSDDLSKKEEFGGFGKMGADAYEKRRSIEDYFKIPTCDFTYEHFVTESKKLLPALRKPVSIIKDLELRREESGFDSGKLDIRRIHKLKTGYTRIFKRDNDQKLDDKELAIAILVDESGSMYSNRSRMAAISVGSMSMALEIAGKMFAVYGFNGDFYHHKKFNKKVYIPELYKSHSNAHSHEAMWNNDGYAIKTTAKELLKRPEKNKIMIVLSDGRPEAKSVCSPEGIYYNDYDLKNEVRSAENNGVKIYAIGIQSVAVREYYNNKRTTVIDEIHELPKVLFDILKKNVGKRVR